MAQPGAWILGRGIKGWNEGLGLVLKTRTRKKEMGRESPKLGRKTGECENSSQPQHSQISCPITVVLSSYRHFSAK